MDKSQLLEKLNKGNPSKEQIISWVTAMPGTLSNRKPSQYKIGDVLQHAIFKHPYILLQKKSDTWVCGLLTSEGNCPEILTECKSRFFEGSFITKALFTVSEVQGSFINNYDNNKHLREVLLELKKIFI